MANKTDNQKAGSDILQSLGSGEGGPHKDYERKQIRNFGMEQIRKVQQQVEEVSGDPESYVIEKVVIGHELARIATSELDLDMEESGPVEKVASIPVGMTDEGSGVYCQILVSQKPRVLVLHYKYQSDDGGGIGTVEATAPPFGDEEAEITHFLTEGMD